MFILKKCLLVFLSSLIFCFNILAIETDDDLPFCLSKTALKEDKNVEKDLSRYYKSTSCITWKGDLVYGPSYTHLNTDLQYELDFVETCSKTIKPRTGSTLTSYDSNFLTVLLSATEENQNGDRARRYDNLYGEKKEDGSYSFFSTKSRKTIKKAVFVSNKTGYKFLQKENPSYLL